jgi:hypothetical protein
MPRGLVADDQEEGSGGNDAADDEVLSDGVVDVEMQLEREVLDFHHFHCWEAEMELHYVWAWSE